MFRFGISSGDSLLTFGLAIAPSYDYKHHEQILATLTAEIKKLEHGPIRKITQERLDKIQVEMNDNKALQLQQEKVLLTL